VQPAVLGWIESNDEGASMKLQGRLDSVVRRAIVQCLREEQKMEGAARLLGIGRQTLYNKIKRFRIVRSDWCGVEPESGCASVESAAVLAHDLCSPGKLSVAATFCGHSGA
jgi:hypothetical protein